MTKPASVAVFFAASLGLTALCQAPGILALRTGVQPSGGLMLLLAVGSSGPTLVAIILCALESGRAGVRELFRRRGRTPWQLAAVALFHVTLAHLLGSAVLALLGRYSAQHLLYPPLRPEQVAIAIVAPLGEEYGWRGYALPRLQSIMHPLAASLVIGVVWALWHVPTFFAPGGSPFDLLPMLALLLPGSVIYTWLYNRSGGSMRIILLAHLGAHIDNVMRAVTLGDGYMPLYSTIVALMLFAGVLIARGGLAHATAVTMS